MTWVIYAFICAILLSASALVEKRVLEKMHSADFFASHSVLNFLFSIPFLFFIDFSQLQGSTLLLIFITAFLSAIAFFLLTKGIRHLEVSTVSPLLALSPGSTALLALFILGERLSPLQIGGIIFMIIGSYILTTQHEAGLLKPFQAIKKSKYIHLVILSLLFYSIGSIFDRAILSTFSVALPIYFFFIHLFIAMLAVPAGSLLGAGFKGIKEGIRLGGVPLVVTSLLTVGYRFFQMEALQLASVGLVSAIKRSSSFFTTLIGGEMFHEHNLPRKIVASIVIIVGSILIIL